MPRQYVIDREQSATGESAWWLVLQELSGMWVVERRWKDFDPAAGTAVVIGTETQSLVTFEQSPAGKRLGGLLRQTLEEAMRDA